MKDCKKDFSILGRTVTMRFSRKAYETFQKELIKDKKNEQFAFGLFSQAKTSDGTTLIVQDIFLPDEDDMHHQSGAGVIPSRNFQATVYLIAEQRKQGVLDIHTHPFQEIPQFSSIDHTESVKNAKYICKRFSYPVTHAMMVLNSSCTAYDAVIYDRSLDAYRQIDVLEILGRRIELKNKRELGNVPLESDSRYSRQMIVPGWDQAALARLKVAVIGLGGNGAQFMQTLVSIGVGTEGWIVGIDPDIVEETNLPRIPYAFPEDVGRSKVTIAAEYARRKNPNVKFYPYPCSVTEQAAIERTKAASVIICAPDNDGARKVCNEVSVKYMIPMIDLGCDIQIEDSKVQAGGQVRVILPGTNACLVCCGGYDPSTAAIELMEDEQAAEHIAHGYGSGPNATPTPSIANLNASIAQFGISALLALVHGEKFGNWDHAYYDQLTAQTMIANTKASESCPLCGKEGIIGTGDQKKKVNIVQPDKSFDLGR